MELLLLVARSQIPTHHIASPDKNKDNADSSDMASPSNRKQPQPAEGSEFPPLDLAQLAKQRKV